MKTLTRSLALVTALAVASFALVACSSKKTSVGTGLILAAQGGVVTVGGTSIAFPANSLAADTEITIRYGNLTDFGPLADARSQVLTIVPANMTLQNPATVTINPGTPAIQSGQIVTIRQYVDGGWYGTAPATVLANGLVTANIDHTAPVAVVVEDAPLGPTGTVTGSVIHYYTEQPLEGWEFTLMNGTSAIDTAFSDANGSFTFTDVPVGSYTVHSEVLPADNCFSDPVDAAAVVTEDQTTSVFFGFVPGPCS